MRAEDSDDNFQNDADADAILHPLLGAGHLEQVLSQAKRFLERDPEAVAPHYYLALAHLRLQRIKEAEISVKLLLERAPDSGFSHHAAYEWLTVKKQLRQAREHIRHAVALEPNAAGFHYHACLAALRLHKLPEVGAAIDMARQLEPQDPDIIRMHVEVHGLQENSAPSAWERIHRLESGLAIDPNNAGLHESIGDIYLHELDQPRTAEQHYRESLLRDPINRKCQRALFQAVARRHFTYRLLSIPARTWRWVCLVIGNWRHQPWRILFLLVAIKGVLVFLVWMLIATVLFWPACRIYEWLVVAEIQSAGAVPARWLRFKRQLSRYPFWLRLTLCALMLFGLWSLLFGLVGVPWAIGFVVLVIFALVHALVIGVEMVGQRLRTRHGYKVAMQKRQPPGV